MVSIVVPAVALVLLFAYVALYNGLVSRRNGVRSAWSQIDVQLKRRHDLVPNLVETVKGYMAHEREVLTRVTEARARAMSAQGVREAGVAEAALGRALADVKVAMEQYPELKADQNARALQEELTSTENRIAFARQHYNDVTEDYNTAIERIPGNVVASLGRFARAEFFELEDASERVAPRVSFGAA